MAEDTWNKTIAGEPKHKIRDYYKENWERMRPWMRNRHVAVKTWYDGKLEVRKHPSGQPSKYITIDTWPEMEEWVKNHALEFWPETAEIKTPNKTNLYIVDLDNRGLPEKKLKQVTRSTYREMKKLPMQKKTLILSTGGKGFHIISKMKKKETFNAARKELKNEVLADVHGQMPLETSIKQGKNRNKVTMDLSPMKRHATFRSPYSIHAKTKNIAVPVTENKLDDFKSVHFNPGRLPDNRKRLKKITSLKPMLLKDMDLNKPGKDWLWETKLDGIRAIAHVDKTSREPRVKFTNRHGKDVTFKYPELAKELPKHVKAKKAVIDGEIIATDKSGKSDFDLLSSRMSMTKESSIKESTEKQKVKFAAFDILKVDDKDVTKKPLIERKKLLSKTIIMPNSVSEVPYTSDSEGIIQRAKRNKEEGVVAKKADSTYNPGQRSKNWLKRKFVKNIDAVAIGYTPGKGKREGGVGSILLGAYDKKGNIQYLGEAGTGWNDEQSKDLKKKLDKQKSKKFPSVKGGPLPSDAVPVKPTTVHRIKYHEITPHKKLRIPVWEGERDDIMPREAHLPSNPFGKGDDDGVVIVKKSKKMPVGSAWVGEKYVHGPRLAQPSEFKRFYTMTPEEAESRGIKISSDLPSGSKVVVGESRSGKLLQQSSLIPRERIGECRECRHVWIKRVKFPKRCPNCGRVLS